MKALFLLKFFATFHNNDKGQVNPRTNEPPDKWTPDKWAPKPRTSEPSDKWTPEHTTDKVLAQKISKCNHRAAAEQVMRAFYLLLVTFLQHLLSTIRTDI